MSKIGIKKIEIPEGVNVEIADRLVKVTGQKGEQSLELPHEITAEKIENAIQVNRKNDSKNAKSLHGLFRNLIANMVTGVSQGFERKLDFKGVGFRAEVSGNKLILNVGFSHPVELEAPEGISFKVEKNVITVSGTELQKVGQAAANVRRVKPVEPYKGKGIKYIDEIPRRKPGKTAKAAVGGGS